MKSLKAILLSLCLCVPTAAAAAPKVYAGKEAQAIRCAQLFLFAGAALKIARVGNQAQINYLNTYGAAIVMQHTTGTKRQKVQAVKQMQRQTSVRKSVEKFKTHSKRCTRQFPIR